MPKKTELSFEQLFKPFMESQLNKMDATVDATDEEVLEQKPDRDAIANLLSALALKLEKIHDDVRELQRDLAYVTSQVDDLQSENW
jgi:chromosome segregation ATPase